MPKKKVKDLDPKSRSKSVKGGGLTDNANRDAKRITKLAVRDAPRSVIRDVTR